MAVETPEIDLAPMQDMLANVEKEMKNPIPTPPVGTTIVWYAKALVEDDSKIAALVTKVEGPGKITVTAFRPQGMADPTRRGCLHVSDPIHEKRHNSVSMNSGAWDYVAFTKIPKEHYQLHLDALAKKRDSLIEKLATAQSIKSKSKQVESLDKELDLDDI